MTWTNLVRTVIKTLRKVAWRGWSGREGLIKG